MSKQRVTNSQLQAIIRNEKTVHVARRALAQDLLDDRFRLAASQQRRRELEADAERYRALKAYKWELIYGNHKRAVLIDYDAGKRVAISIKPYDLDEAIDAAIAAQRQKEGE